METVRLTTAAALVRYLVAQRTVLDGDEVAAVPRRLRHLRARQRHVPRPALQEARRRAADVARPERAGHGAGRRRLRQGDAPPPDHGGDVVDRARRAQHGHRRRRGPCQPAAGAAAGRRHVRRAGCPTRCCSRSSTSAIRRSPSTTPSSRSSATGTASRGPSSSCSRCRRRSRRCSTRPTAARRSSRLPQDVQAEAFDFPDAFFEPVVHEIARPRAPTSTSCGAPPTLMRGARRPLIIAGGGVHYSAAEAELAALRRGPQHPGRRDDGRQGVACSATTRCNAGPVGVTGCDAGQRARRRGRRRARRRHPPAGLHHRLVDGVPRRGPAPGRRHQRRRASTPSSTARSPVVGRRPRGAARAGRAARRLARGRRRGAAARPRDAGVPRATSTSSRAAGPTASDADVRPGGRRGRPRSPRRTTTSLAGRRRLPRRAD